MRIEDRPRAALELLITDILRSESLGSGDLRIEYEASVDNFAGKGWCWVTADDFHAFAVAARQILTSFNGRAKLTSMSPGEMSFSLSPANSRYVLVQFAGAKTQPLPCSMSGAFEVELAALVPVVAWAEHPQRESE
jgi:hypothetical protein